MTRNFSIFIKLYLLLVHIDLLLLHHVNFFHQMFFYLNINFILYNLVYSTIKLLLYNPTLHNASTSSKDSYLSGIATNLFDTSILLSNVFVLLPLSFFPFKFYLYLLIYLLFI